MFQTTNQLGLQLLNWDVRLTLNMEPSAKEGSKVRQMPKPGDFTGSMQHFDFQRSAMSACQSVT